MERERKVVMFGDGVDPSVTRQIISRASQSGKTLELERDTGLTYVKPLDFPRQGPGIMEMMRDAIRNNEKEKVLKLLDIAPKINGISDATVRKLNKLAKKAGMDSVIERAYR